MEYKFKRVMEHGYIITEDGHTMFPEDVVKRLEEKETLRRKTKLAMCEANSNAVLGEGPTIDQCKDLLLQLQRAGIYRLTDEAFGDTRYDDLKTDIIKKWIVDLLA